MFFKVVLGILLTVSVSFASLPKKVLADKYLLQAKQSMESKDYKSAQLYFEKILSLDVKVPNNFHYFYAKTLFSNKNYKKTLNELELFLKQGGDKSKHYVKSLELYAKAEKEEKAIAEKIKADKEKWITPSNSIYQANGCSLYEESENSYYVTTWQEAKNICRTIGGRLPTIDELTQVMKTCGEVVVEVDLANMYNEKTKKKSENLNYQHCFKQIGFDTESIYWSSSYTSYKRDAWVVNFGLGIKGKRLKIGWGDVRCVRRQ